MSHKIHLMISIIIIKKKLSKNVCIALIQQNKNVLFFLIVHLDWFISLELQFTVEVNTCELKRVKDTNERMGYINKPINQPAE